MAHKKRFHFFVIQKRLPLSVPSATCTNMARPLKGQEKHRTKHLGVRVTEKTHHALLAAAAARGESLSDAVNDAVEAWLIRHMLSRVARKQQTNES